MVQASYDVAVDFDGSELFTETGEDVLADVSTDPPGQARSGLASMVRGRDQARLLAPPRAGEAGFTLDNTGGDYGPSSDLQAGRLARIRATYDGTTYPLHTGILDRPVQVPDALVPRVRVKTFGTLTRLVGKRLSTALYSSIRTDEAIGHVLDAASWPKNLQAYITSLAPAGQWGLGEASGDAIDLSGNGNDGTVAYLDGQRDTAALDDAGDGSITFADGTLNLVKNPSLEVDTTHWQAQNSAIARVTSQSLKGTASLEIIATNVNASGARAHLGAGDKMAVVAGTVYTGSVYAKLSAAGSVALNALVDWYDSGEGYLSTSVVGVTLNTTNWSQRLTTGALTAPVNAAFAAFSLNTAGAQGVFTMYLDGAQFEAKSSASLYTDGAQGTGYAWSGTPHDSTSTRADTLVAIASDATIDDIWDGGGAAFALFNATSSGESGFGRIFEKNQWMLSVGDATGGAMRLYLYKAFSGTPGNWKTTSRVVTAGRAYAVCVLYNASAVANNPTVYLYDIAARTLSTLTVGSGIDEDTTPVGTRTSEAGSNLTLSHTDIAFDGVIDEAALFKGTQPTLAQIKAAFARTSDAPRHLDTGKTTLSWWWLDRQDAFAAVVELLNTEGPGAVLYEDGTGAIVFKNRTARVSESRSTSIQTTFRSTGSEPLIDGPFMYDRGIKDVVNVCELTVRTRAAQASAQVWALGSTVTLAPGETRSFTARQSDGDPFTAAITPTSGGGDYTVSAGSMASVSLDRTSGAEVTITLVAGATGATVTGLRLRAQSVEVTNTTTVRNLIDTSASQAQYGTQTFKLATRAEIPINTAQDFANAVVGFQQDGRPVAEVAILANGDAARMTASLAREVSDRVRLIEGNVGVDAEFYIGSVRHEVYAPATHITRFTLEEADAATYYVLGVSALDGVDGFSW